MASSSAANCSRWPVWRVCPVPETLAWTAIDDAAGCMKIGSAPPPPAGDASMYSIISARRGASIWSEPSQRQELHRQLTITPERQIGHCLAHHAGELEPMPAEPAGNRDVAVPRVAVENEVRVGAVGVETDPKRQEWAVGRGEHLPQQRAESFLVARQKVAHDLVGIGLRARAMVGDFEAGNLWDHGEPVVQ